METSRPLCDKEIKEKLGDAAYNLILDHADNNDIDEQKMKDMAELLEVGGANRRRGCNAGPIEMRHVLTDWYQAELHGLDRESSLKRLIGVLEDRSIGLRPLAAKLRQMLVKTDPVSSALMIVPNAIIDASSKNCDEYDIEVNHKKYCP